MGHSTPPITPFLKMIVDSRVGLILELAKDAKISA